MILFAHLTETMTKIKNSCAVVVGRFQVPYLTAGHLNFLSHVISQGHERNIIFLGVPHKDVRSTKRNPIPYEARAEMIRQQFDNKFEIFCIEDVGDIQKWSQNLDEKIEMIKRENDSVTLYGSRNSFLDAYTGKYDKSYYKPVIEVSGSDIRKKCAKLRTTSRDFRLGCVYTTERSWTSFFPTVDCAIFSDTSFTKIYMGKKKGESLYRFIGGFWDAADENVEAAAIREAREETNLETVVDSYICTQRIDDPRYRGEYEKIMTTFYLMHRVDGEAIASDDMAELELIDIKELNENNVNPAHICLLNKLKEHLAKIVSTTI